MLLLAILPLTACKKDCDCGKDLLTKMAVLEKKLAIAQNEAGICNKKKFIGQVSDCSKEEAFLEELSKEYKELQKQLLEMK